MSDVGGDRKLARPEQSQVGWDQVSLSVFSGMKYSLALVLIAIALLAILYMVGWDWMNNDRIVYEYINYAAVVLGGFIAGTKLKAKGWLSGVLLAVVYWVLMLLLTKILGVQPITLQHSLIRIGIAALLGALGGIIGVNV
jgi:putative membrane protein (TIGR04086 family)